MTARCEIRDEHVDAIERFVGLHDGNLSAACRTLNKQALKRGLKPISRRQLKRILDNRDVHELNPNTFKCLELIIVLCRVANGGSDGDAVSQTHGLARELLDGIIANLKVRGMELELLAQDHDVSEVAPAFFREVHNNGIDMLVEKFDELLNTHAPGSNHGGAQVDFVARKASGSFCFDDIDFEGGLLDGLPSGQGAYTLPSGFSFTGNFENGLPHGRGEYAWPDGSKFIGNWENGKIHGKGTYLSGGHKAQGTFEHGRAHGAFVYELKDGSRFECIYMDGIPLRECRETWPDGETTTGQFKSFRRDGYGVTEFPNGVSMYRRWKMGQLVEFSPVLFSLPLHVVIENYEDALARYIYKAPGHEKIQHKTFLKMLMHLAFIEKVMPGWLRLSLAVIRGVREQ